jgi:hypothetical protein
VADFVLAATSHATRKFSCSASSALRLVSDVITAQGISRQFYYVWALLGTDEVLDFLANKRLSSDVLTSCFKVSRAFIPDLPLPDGRFSASPASATRGPLTPRLRIEHETAMDSLYYGTDDPPSFDAVLERIQTTSTRSISAS